jgi:hypothetical protein
MIFTNMNAAGITGAAVLSFSPKESFVGTLMGIYLIPAIYSITTVVQIWAMANVSGHTKRAFMAGMMAACHGM